MGEQKKLARHTVGLVCAQFTRAACSQNESEFAEHDAPDSSNILTSFIEHGAMHFFWICSIQGAFND
jgi:hypothetical protein